MKTALTAIAAAVVLTGGLAGCANQPSKNAAAAPADKVAVGTCPWPRNVSYSNSCKATYKAPVRSATPVSYTPRECSWPVRGAPKIC